MNTIFTQVMKPLKYFLIPILFLIIFPEKTYPQHITFYSKPAIYLIDDTEKFLNKRYNQQWMERYETEWLTDFYDALERGTENPRYSEIMNGTGKVLLAVLEDDNISFIINSWLYVISYEPNPKKSRNDRDYEDIEKRKAWLYRKNLKDKGDWEAACSYPVFQHAITFGYYNADAFSLSPARKNSGGSSDVILPDSIANAAVILCGIEINYSRDFYLVNKVLVLSPMEIHENGSIDYEIEDFCGIYNYPEEVTKILNGGKTIETIDNNGNKKFIYLTLSNNINGQPNHVSFYGDYGFSRNISR